MAQRNITNFFQKMSNDELSSASSRSVSSQNAVIPCSQLTTSQLERIQKQKVEALRRRAQKSHNPLPDASCLTESPDISSSAHLFSVNAAASLVKVGSTVIHSLKGKGRVLKITRNPQFSLEAHVELENGQIACGSAISGVDFHSDVIDPTICTLSNLKSSPSHTAKLVDLQSSPSTLLTNIDGFSKKNENVITDPSSPLAFKRSECPPSPATCVRGKKAIFGNTPSPATSANQFPSQCRMFSARKSIFSEADLLQIHKVMPESKIFSEEQPSQKPKVEMKPSPRKQLLKTESSAPEDSWGVWEWLKPSVRRDCFGRRIGDVGYDSSTVLIPPRHYENMSGYFFFKMCLSKLRLCSRFTKQYWDLKKVNFDIVLFVKVGKFYELYEDDADVGHKALGLNFTHGGVRDPNSKRMRCVGVPECKVEDAIAKLVPLGLKVGIVEEMEAASNSGPKKIILRSLKKIFSPGTLVDESMIGPESRLACCIYPSEDIIERDFFQSWNFGICFLDASTARFELGHVKGFHELEAVVKISQPREIIFPHGKIPPAMKNLISCCVPFATWTAQRIGDKEGEIWSPTCLATRLPTYFEDDQMRIPEALAQLLSETEISYAFGGMISYLKKLNLDAELVPIGVFDCVQGLGRMARRYMMLDAQTLSDLNILDCGVPRSLSSPRNNLFSHLDRCKTGFGRRLLRWWVTHPLLNIEEIEARHCALDNILTEDSLCTAFNILEGIPDLERKISRIRVCMRQNIHTQGVAERNASQKRNVQDLVSAVEGFCVIDRFHKALLSEVSVVTSSLLESRILLLPDLKPALDEICSTFDFNVAQSIGKLELIHGIHAGYDNARKQKDNAENSLEDYLRCQKRDLHCPSLCYFRSGKDSILLQLPRTRTPPADYELVSSTKEYHRYISSALLALAQELNLAIQLFEQEQQKAVSFVCSIFDRHFDEWSKSILCIAELDALQALAQSSKAVNVGETMCRPEFVHQCDSNPLPCLHIQTLRHPFLFRESGQQCVPVDISVGNLSECGQCALITGPNMGGKSTILRLGCLAVILAQLGCKVPATKCTLHPVDRVFTRLGANDDIMRGVSTFQAEMQDVSQMLSKATKHSLLAIDELGRGTSTFDGHAIAFSVLHDIINRIGCRTLFATHYHGLVQDFIQNDRVTAFHMAFKMESSLEQSIHACQPCEQTSGALVMLYRLERGACPRSFGTECARCAGLPSALIHRAQKVSQEFEERQTYRNAKGLGSLSGSKRGFDSAMCAGETALDLVDIQRFAKIWKGAMIDKALHFDLTGIQNKLRSLHYRPRGWHNCHT